MIGKSILCFCTTQVFYVKFKTRILSGFLAIFQSYQALIHSHNLLFIIVIM